MADAILDAAEQVIAERGLERAAMTEIAGRAGVAVGTVYNYFPDRDGLVAALFKARRAAIAPRIVAAGAVEAQPFEARLRAVVGAIYQVFEDHRQFLKIVFDAEQQPPATRKDKGRTVLTAMRDALRGVLADGAAQGVFPAEEIDRLFFLLKGAMRGLMHDRLEKSGAFTEDAALLCDVFLHGVAGR